MFVRQYIIIYYSIYFIGISIADVSTLAISTVLHVRLDVNAIIIKTNKILNFTIYYNSRIIDIKKSEIRNIDNYLCIQLDILYNEGFSTINVLLFQNKIHTKRFPQESN